MQIEVEAQAWIWNEDLKVGGSEGHNKHTINNV